MAAAHATELLTALGSAHAFTAKAPRDPTLIREGTGRGKKGRRRAR